MVKLCRQSPGSVGAPPEKLTNRPARRGSLQRPCQPLARHKTATSYPSCSHGVRWVRGGRGAGQGGRGREPRAHIP